jgi:hypothetical protein
MIEAVKVAAGFEISKRDIVCDAIAHDETVYE